MRRLLYFLGLFALLVAALLAWPGSATAHAYLDRADPPPDSVLPTSPDTIQLWFTEPLEPNFSEIVIMNSAGQPISTAKSQIGADGVSMTLDLGNLSEGSYTVTWRTLSTAD